MRDKTITTVRPDRAPGLSSGINIIPTNPFAQRAVDLGNVRPKGEPIEGGRGIDPLAFLEDLKGAMREDALDGKDKEGNTP